MILIYYPILYIINNIPTRCSRYTDCIIVLYYHYRGREALYTMVHAFNHYYFSLYIVIQAQYNIFTQK